MRTKREGPCRVQGHRSTGPGPGGQPRTSTHRSRPAAATSAALVVRQNRPGPPGRGVSSVPGVSPAPQPLVSQFQVQDCPPPACFPPTTALRPGPGIRTAPPRHRLWPPPASRPGQGFASAAKKKTGESKMSAGGRTGPWVPNSAVPVALQVSNSSGLGLGKFGLRHVFEDGEPQSCRPSAPKLYPTIRVSTPGAKAAQGLQEAQVSLCPKESSLSRTLPPKVSFLVPEIRRLPGAPPPNPTVPARPQISGSPRDSLKGWLAGGQVCAPALNPGSPLWSLLSPG